VLGCPARDETDEAGLRMLAALLAPERSDLAVASPALLASEVLELVALQQVPVVCVAALPPGGAEHARLLCRRLRARFPELKILVARWGVEDGATGSGDALMAAGADAVATTFAETRQQVAASVQLLSTRAGSPDLSATPALGSVGSPATAPAA
jgi:hypothetical protein